MQAHAVDQQIDDVGRKSFGRRFRRTPIWHEPVTDTRPELLLRDAQLISQDVALAGPVRAASEEIQQAGCVVGIGWWFDRWRVGAPCPKRLDDVLRNLEQLLGE